MVTRWVGGKLFVWMTVLVLSALNLPASASTILVREELGFSFLPSGIEFTLEENGPTAVYDLSSQFGAGAIFELRYASDFFVMTALADNTVADAPSLPFGIDIYPGNVTPISPEFDCALTTPCYNGLRFFPWFDFPLVAGEFVSLLVDTPAVDEPPVLMLLAVALVLLAWTRARAQPGRSYRRWQFRLRL